MSTNLQNSIVLVNSRDAGKANFGTGFVIHQDADFTYILTCAHVISDVGGPKKVAVRRVPVTVYKSGEKNGVDLAILRVEGLTKVPLLDLGESGRVGDSFIIAGFHKLKNHYRLKEIRGKLGEPVGLESREQATRMEAWEIEIGRGYELQPGYSGAPVVDEHSGRVVALVSYREGGQKGLAISLSALKYIWPDMPPGLLQEKPSGCSPAVLDEGDDGSLITDFLEITPGTLHVPCDQWVSRLLSFKNYTSESFHNISIALRPGTWQVTVKPTKYQLGDLKPGDSKSIEIEIRVNAQHKSNPTLHLTIFSNEKRPQKENLTIKARRLANAKCT
jgi:hypothetical protein